MTKFTNGERVLFEKRLGFIRHDGTRVLLAEEGAKGTVLGTFDGFRPPRPVLVKLDAPSTTMYESVEVPEDYLTAE